MSPPTSPEHELALLLCGTEERRAAREQEAAALFQSASESELLALIERLNVVTLVGQRLLALGLRPAGSVIERIERLTQISRDHETLLEVMMLSILANLETAGIRALPLKGSVLARELHGDPALEARSTSTSSSHRGSSVALPRSCALWDGATSIASGIGFRCCTTVWAIRRFRGSSCTGESTGTRTSSRLTLSPPLRAPRSGAPLRMQPAEELASLLLFYARDGFSGLRVPADIAAWWGVCGGQLAGRSHVSEIAARYPALGAPLRVGSAVLDALVGVPGASLDASPLCWRAASELANPFLLGGDSQIQATASLIDLALAPPGGRLESIRRELGRVPPANGDTPSRARIPFWFATAEHALRVLRRWVSAGARALVALVGSRRA